MTEYFRVAFIERSFQDQKITAASIEYSLHCKVLYGLGSDSSLTPLQSVLMGSVQQAFKSMSDYIYDRLGRDEPSETPTIVVFDARVAETRFILEYGSVIYARFWADEEKLKNISSTGVVIETIDSALISLGDSIEAVREASELLQKSGETFPTSEVWVSSSESLLDSMQTILESKSELLYEQFQSGWEV
ncbi:hypothetical protein [Aestuariivirga sp.]|uniref:hypothetical protein n=1 Tax=Aestuariivirga sp. TaxID=2650926 RepID=UPI003BABD8DE